jgi:serine/threonine protein kinase
MLIDFGATRYSIGAKSQSLSVILTPGYAPKEQYSSRSKQGNFTDLYAVGAVMYKMVTGTSPIESSERSDIITNDEPDPHIKLMEMNYPKYSDRFKKAIDWALEFKPKDRPQSVEELQKALEAKQKNREEKTEIKSIAKTKEPLPEVKKEDNEKKSNLLPIIGSVAIAVAVTVVAVNYYNDTQESKRVEQELIVKKQKEAEVKKQQEERITQIALDKERKETLTLELEKKRKESKKRDKKAEDTYLEQLAELSKKIDKDEKRKAKEKTRSLIHNVTVNPRAILWFGFINIDTQESKEFMTTKSTTMDIGEQRWILILGHGRVTIETNKETLKIDDRTKHYYYIDSRNIKEITRSKFKEFNGGRGW